MHSDQESSKLLDELRGQSHFEKESLVQWTKDLQSFNISKFVIGQFQARENEASQEKIQFQLAKDFIVFTQEPLKLVVTEFKQENRFEINVEEYYPNSMIEVEKFAISDSVEMNFFIAVELSISQVIFILCYLDEENTKRYARIPFAKKNDSKVKSLFWNHLSAVLEFEDHFECVEFLSIPTSENLEKYFSQLAENIRSSQSITKLKDTLLFHFKLDVCFQLTSSALYSVTSEGQKGPF